MKRNTDTSFYNSKAWKRVRKNIWIKQSCLCARCFKPVYVKGLSDNIPVDKRIKGIVHHKTHLNFENVKDDLIALDESNLEGLCIFCHNKEHFASSVTKDDVMFDEHGNLIQR